MTLLVGHHWLAKTQVRLPSAQSSLVWPASSTGYGTAECDWQFSCRILLFDEATSALDSSTENSILDTLQRLGQGRTTLFVAHRLSTAARCNQARMLTSQRSTTCCHAVFSDFPQMLRC